MRHREVAQKLQVLHLESLAESRIEVCILSLKRFSKFFGRMHYLQHFNFTNFFFLQNWMADKEEVQLVDMVLRIRNKLAEAIGI